MDNKDTNSEISNIYYGSRGEDFKKLLIGLLRKGKLHDHYIKILLSEDSLKIYNDVFTSDSADATNNYEVYEQLGDVLAGSFIIWYMYRRFPHLMCPEAVKIVARLKINFGSKATFFGIADKLGFWPFITATEEERMKIRKDLLEDVLEGFIGATAYILDNKIRQGVGYAIVYDILSSIFNEINITLSYESLYDAKTRLKEIFDYFKQAIGTQEVQFTKQDATETSQHRLTTCIIFRVFEGNKYEIGKGMAVKKIDAEQKAAEYAIESLARVGFVRPVPQAHLYESIAAYAPPPPPPITNLKTRLCRQWQAGYCPRGPQCHFAHGMNELRRPFK